MDRAYSVSASQAACDVVRSCCLAPECRVVLTQSGFFADLVGQIRYVSLFIFYFLSSFEFTLDLHPGQCHW